MIREQSRQEEELIALTYAKSYKLALEMNGRRKDVGSEPLGRVLLEFLPQLRRTFNHTIRLFLRFRR